MSAIGRLLAHEYTASDLLAYLIELDPRPLAQVLGLPADNTARSGTSDGGGVCQRSGVGMTSSQPMSGANIRVHARP